MKTNRSITAGTALAALCATFALSAALPGTAQADHLRHSGHSAPPLEITVSCQRYASSQVIWDRPTGIFVQDLQKVGYEPSEALAIATAICRDERIVGDKEGLGDAMLRYYRANPPR